MYSKGVMWLDDCRIPFVDGNDIPQATTQRDSEEMNHKTKELLGYEKWGVGMDLDVIRVPYEQNQQGRFTPNLLVCDDMLNDGKTYGNLFKQNRNKDVDGGTGNSLVRAHKQGESNGVFDGGTSSSRFYDLDLWFEKMLDRL